MAPAAIRGIVILVITWAIVSLLRRQAANLRSLVWTIGLAAALIAPLLGYQPVTFDVDIPNAVRARFSTSSSRPRLSSRSSHSLFPILKQTPLASKVVEPPDRSASRCRTRPDKPRSGPRSKLRINHRANLRDDRSAGNSRP
ncbi:MAG: hypothetical protein R2849_07265 [Thermomicrobiales bacterium]